MARRGRAGERSHTQPAVSYARAASGSADRLRRKKAAGSLTVCALPGRERKKGEDKVMKEGYFRHYHRSGPHVRDNGGNQTEGERNYMRGKKV